MRGLLLFASLGSQPLNPVWGRKQRNVTATHSWSIRYILDNITPCPQRIGTHGTESRAFPLLSSHLLQKDRGPVVSLRLYEHEPTHPLFAEEQVPYEEEYCAEYSSSDTASSRSMWCGFGIRIMKSLAANSYLEASIQRTKSCLSWKTTQKHPV